MCGNVNARSMGARLGIIISRTATLCNSKASGNTRTLGPMLSGTTKVCSSMTTSTLDVVRMARRLRGTVSMFQLRSTSIREPISCSSCVRGQDFRGKFSR